MNFLFYTLLLFSIPAHTVQGPFLEKTTFDSVCRIIIKSKKDKSLLGLCTGTLISKNTVQTAAHCIFKNAEYVISCGYLDFIKGNQKILVTKNGGKVYVGGPHFKEQQTVSSVSILKKFPDKAVIKLKKPSLLKFAKVVSAERLRKTLTKEKCYFSGYGISNKIAGVPNTVSLKNQKFNFYKKEQFFEFKSNISGNYSPSYLNPSSSFDPNPRIQPGDSGLSVLCENKEGLQSYGIATSAVNEFYSTDGLYENKFTISSKDDLKKSNNQ